MGPTGVRFMGRRRKSNPHFPKNVYLQAGAIRYKVPAEYRERLGRSWIKLGTTEDEMWAEYGKLQAGLNSAGGMQILFTRYRNEIIPTKAPRTQEDNLRHIVLLEQVFGDMEPGHVTRAMGIAYLRRRGAQAKTQAKQEFALLRHVMTCAVDWGAGGMRVNPLLGTEVNKILQIKVRERVPEMWELLAVKKHGGEMIGLWIDMRYQTGLDQAVLLHLPVPRLDRDGIPVRRNKTHKRGMIEWTPDLRTTVTRILEMNRVQGLSLFCNSRGRPIKQRTFQSRWREAVKKAIKAGDLLENFHENDIRSKFATDSEELYGHDATDQLLHSSAGAKKHYVHRRQTKISSLPLGKLGGKKS